MRRYRNMKEIDKDLQLMELKIHLEKEKINLGVKQLKKQTEPQALIKGFLVSSVKNISVLSMLGSLFKGKKKRKSRRKKRR